MNEGEKLKTIVLGTAQLGLNYGINNVAGKPSKKLVYNILDCAYDYGIKDLDTATAYGDSELVIGEYIRKTNRQFDISTKLPLLKETGDISNVIERQFKTSLKNLGIDKIKTYYLHTFADCKKEKVLSALLSLKSDGYIENLGISIYEPVELEYIIKFLKDIIDVVQIPFNIFDVRWTKCNLLQKCSENNILINARSIYLQGLAFIDCNSTLSKSLAASMFLEYVQSLSQKKDTTIEKVLFDYVNFYEELSSIIIGCETLSQLLDNIAIINKPSVLQEKDISEILEKMANVSEKMIDPRKW